MTESTEKPKRSWWAVSARFISILCFISLIPLFVVTISKLVGYEESKFIVLVTSFTFYIYLPVYFMLAFALMARRKVLRIVCLPLIVCHVAWVQPEIRPASDLPQEAASAPKLTVLSQNVKFDNPTPERVAKTIRETNADVVMLQELTYDTEAVLKDSGVLRDYPYSYSRLTPGPSGIGMWSKIKFDSTRRQALGLPALRVTLDVGGKEVVLWNIHTYSPMTEQGDSVRLWNRGLDQAKTALHAETGNVIAAGDFNATWSHDAYRSIVAKGYRDVHIDRGDGYARTWPADAGWIGERGGLIRIDHVLTKGSVRATSIKQVAGLGSDHRGNFTTFAIL